MYIYGLTINEKNMVKTDHEGTRTPASGTPVEPIHTSPWFWVPSN